MRDRYDHKAIEPKWQKKWAEEKLGQAESHSTKKKTYLLIEFPYPSGAGLHTGHVRSYTALDIIARKRRRQGENVLYPIGWDAFGLPTENYAIKTGRDPREVTKENTDNFRRQLHALGMSFDWSREVNTTDPAYYKWTQWIFLQMFKKGLAYKATVPINWCPKDKIGLANEEVVDGKCERCGTPVVKREKDQWMLAITKYADRLYDDLDTVDYIERVKLQQRNWIGRSEGAEIEFGIKHQESKIKVFTTRADTLFGATYVVLSPEHPLLQNQELGIKNQEEVATYIADAKKKTEIERTAETKEKTGVRLDGVVAVNPVNQEEIPIFVADYVLASYGTGAIMAVPAHDERDFAFAKKYNLPVITVITGGDGGLYIGEGPLMNSGSFTGMDSALARKKITEFVGGTLATKYKLRDWVFSRQRYWGEPIPLIFCEKCQWVPVPEEQLPVELPHVEKYEPTDTGESPLANIEDWVNTPCPTCGGPAKRETDVMPQWAGSSWYYLAYTMQGISDFQFPIANYKDTFKYWLPVDWYNGGMEHTTLHLLYSRFWHKFLFDIGAVETPEPYTKRTSHGLILGADGEKMSKSKGNTVSPDEAVERFGADALRLYEMFMGPFEQAIPWNEDGLVGTYRFLERVWRLYEQVSDNVADEVRTECAAIVEEAKNKVAGDIELLKMNTAVSALMICTNALEKCKPMTREAYETLLLLLAPFAPHMTEELWYTLGHTTSIHAEPWPAYDPEKARHKNGEITVAVQVDGKVRATITLKETADASWVEQQVRSMPELAKWIGDGTGVVIRYIPRKIVSIATKKA